MKFKHLRTLFALVILASVVCVTGCDDPQDLPEKPNPEISNPSVPDPDESDPDESDPDESDPDESDSDVPDSDAPEPDEPEPPQEILRVPGLSFTTLTLSNEGDTFACIIHGFTGKTWRAESDQAWCIVSIHNNVLKISVNPNNEGGNRSATISIFDSDDSEIGNIIVNQCATSGNKPIEFSTLTKHSFFPLFTATWCPFSPDMDRTLEEVQKRWKYTIIPMRIHVKDSGLSNQLYKELSELYDNSTTPTGYFENYFEVNNVHEDNVSVDYFWNLILSYTNSSNDYPTLCSSIGCKELMTDEEISAEITIKPAVAGEYRIITFLLEDNIIMPQMSTEGEIPNYCHNDVLIGALTPVKGQEMALTTTPKTLTLSGNIPNNVNLSNLRLLIVIERNIANLNYSERCWYADNCLSVPLGKSSGSGTIENIYIGDEINN